MCYSCNNVMVTDHSIRQVTVFSGLVVIVRSFSLAVVLALDNPNCIVEFLELGSQLACYSQLVTTILRYSRFRIAFSLCSQNALRFEN
jgi:hypothetical protein